MEIERKFLLKELPSDLENYPVRHLEQGYLCTGPVVRIRKDNDKYELTYKAKGSKLSGGQKQRTVIARALAKDSPIILADEPTGNLDPQNAMEIMKLLEEINRRGTTVIVVTHSRELVNTMKKRVITMDKGIVISDVKEGGYRYEN